MNNRKYRSGKTCFITLLVQIFLMVSFFFTALFSVSASELTLVQVEPATVVVSAEETFTLDIYCAPAQPIKSFEFRVSFDPLLLQVNSVSEGDIFEGYSTFFNEGTIDNTEGTIVDIYNLIVGQGSISEPGVFVSISFTAQSRSGTSIINLNNVGVTDDAGYVSISVSDGNVTVLGENQPPTLSSPSPSNGATDVSVSASALSITIQDHEGDTFDWSITTSPNIGSAYGINTSNGSKSCSLSGLGYSTIYHWYVSCRDIGSGNWTNASYSFTTESEPQGGGSPGGGGSSGGDDQLPPESEQNSPPQTPSTPIGPVFVESGVMYSYSSTAVDSDGDTVRLRFDWGDGTLSNWTELVDSNFSVSSIHAWTSIYSFTLRVIAQDITGTNSSWSSSLTVTVSQGSEEDGGEEPVLDIDAPQNGYTNQTISFNASGSVDPNGVIISYLWEFGDGSTATGKNPTHSYNKPGVYQVTLTVTDSAGITYTKTYFVTIEAGANASSSEQETGLLPSFFIALLVIIAIVCGLFVIFRKRMRKGFSHEYPKYEEKKIAQLDTKIRDLNKKIDQKTTDQKYKIDDQSQATYHDESLEEKVDEAIIAKIREKIDEW